MSRRERMSPVDFAWLRMDRPTNLMMIVAVDIFEGPVDIDRLETHLGDGLTAYRRFRQRVEQVSSGAYWRDDPNFDLARHIHRVRLPGRGGKTELQRFVGELAATPLDFAHPLWQIHLIEKYEGGVAAVFRIHHAIADGIALVGVTLSLADDAPEPEAMARRSDEEGWPQSFFAPFVAAIEVGAKASGFTLKHALEVVRQPRLAVDYLKTGADVAAELAYLLLMPTDSDTRFKGQPHGAKRVAWSEPLRLADVKSVAKALGATINDLLLSCVAGALRSYLVEKGDDADGVELRALTPINLRPPGSEGELGNRFGLLALELPVGVKDPLQRLNVVRERMQALKDSVEPPVTLGLLGAMGYAPKYLQDQFGDLINSKASAVMTNVPGPLTKLKIAGSVLKQALVWVPQSGDIGLGVSILSYGGEVQFGLISDAALTPDPEAVIAHFRPEFDGYLYYCLLDPAMAG